MQTDKLFTGQREMRRPECYAIEGAGLGIYHYGARFYSPKLGRFLSADTIVPGASNPQAFNRYSYVLNNPLMYIDPSGHNPCRSDYLCKRRAEKLARNQAAAQKAADEKAAAEEAFRLFQQTAQYAYAAQYGCTSSACGSGASTTVGGGSASGGVYGGSGGHPVPRQNQSGGNNNNQNDVLKPPPFTQSASIQSTIYSGPQVCAVFDCVLSAVSILASGIITAVPKLPEVVGIAFAVDLVVTVWAVLRTNEDYAQGKISQERQWILNGTGIIGVLPIPYVGFGFSIINGMATFSGYPP